MYYVYLLRCADGTLYTGFTNDLARRLADRRVLLEVTPAARSAIVDRGYDPMYGARPLKRFIQTAIETRIARKLIATDLEPDSTLVVDFQSGEFTVKEK